MKLQERNGQFTLTLPKELIRLLGWKKDDNIYGTTDQYNKDMILVKR